MNHNLPNPLVREYQRIIEENRARHARGLDRQSNILAPIVGLIAIACALAAFPW